MTLSKSISKEIFRAYDIRGIVETALTPQVVFKIGKALGLKTIKNNESQMVVGRDGRLSGPLLMAALIDGIASTGCNVVDIGMIPTPLMYFATEHLNIASGVVITGSHNPPDYNGLKIILGGKALYGEAIQAIYHDILQQDNILQQQECFSVDEKSSKQSIPATQASQTTQKNSGFGNIKVIDIVEHYITCIRNSLHQMNPLKPLKIVVDCGNGIAGKVAPLLYEALGCEVIPLYCEVDGNFPNHHPDPAKPENLQDLIAAVLHHKATLGLSFDGDGDRLGVVDNLGNIIWPDRLLILFAREIIKQDPDTEILFDVKCTRHVAKEIAKLNGRSLMWKTGHSLIKAKMKETGSKLAGEMSGHLFFKDRWFGFDDALYAGARLLEVIAEQQPIASSTIFASLPDSMNTPELTIGVLEEDKAFIVEELIKTAIFENAIVSTIDGLRVDFEDGFGLVRPSNTGPNLILRFEGDNSTALERIIETFRQLLININPKLTFSV